MDKIRVPIRKRLVWQGSADAQIPQDPAEGQVESRGQPSHLQSIDKSALAARTRWIWIPLILFGISRLAIILAAYLGSILLPDSANPPVYHLRPPENLLVDVFGSRWDTGFYVSIAEQGYRYDGVPLPSVPFFPLFPLMMRALTPLVGDTLIAGIMISNMALLLAMILLYLLVNREWSRNTADRAVWYMLIFPAAFFGAAIYSESLFLLGAIGALYAARRGYWEIAGLLGILTTLTRFMGIIVVPLLLVEWLSQRRSKPDGEKPLYSILAIPASLLGLFGYILYLGQRFGDPLAFLHGSEAWGRMPQAPWVTVAELFRTPAGGWLSAIAGGGVHIDNWIDFSMVFLFLILGMALIIRRRWSEGVFVLTGTLIAFSSGLLMSQRRYVWVLFPAFILLALWGENPWVDRLVTALSLIGLGLFTALFANGYWVG